MKLELNRQEFLKAWQIAERFVDSKNATDAVSGILISASDDGNVILEATDLKTSVRCRAEGANIIESGRAVVPAMILGSMIKKSAVDTLILDVTAERGYLNAGKSKTRFAVFQGEEFPKIPESASADTICEILAADLGRVINYGSSAASLPEDFPKYMGTLLLRTQQGEIKGVATDGKRLSLFRTSCGNISRDEDMLIPSPAAKELGKTLTSGYDAAANVKILADDSTVWFKLENNGVEFSIRKVEATFPVYERILNDTVMTSLEIDTGELLSVLERIDIIAKTMPAHIMSMTLDPNGSIKITSRAPEKGTAIENVEANVSGEKLQLGFNVGYFMDGLKVLGPGKASIEFSGEETQARMRRAENNEFLYMLMPARLSPQDRIADAEMGEFENGNTENQGNPDENN